MGGRTEGEDVCMHVKRRRKRGRRLRLFRRRNITSPHTRNDYWVLLCQEKQGEAGTLLLLLLLRPFLPRRKNTPALLAYIFREEAWCGEK